MDNSVKVTSVHIFAALIAGYLSSVFTLGIISGIGTNDILATLIGLVILYIAGQVCNKIFGKEEKRTAWLWNGIIPFMFVWFVFWTMLINYSNILY